MHPPPPPKLLVAYRALAIRLPEEYRAWAVEDTAGKSFLTWRIVRSCLFGLLLATLFAVGQQSQHELPGERWLRAAFGIALAFGLLSSRATLVRKTLRWQRVDRHGNPVAPKGLFATLSNIEAAQVVVLSVVLWTCAWAVAGYGLRPGGLAAIPCEAPDPATRARITDAFRKPGTALDQATMVPYRSGVVVSAFIVEAGKPDKSFVAFVTQGDAMYELTPKDATPQTTHKTPTSLDPVVGEALKRSVQCLTEGAPR